MQIPHCCFSFSVVNALWGAHFCWRSIQKWACLIALGLGQQKLAASLGSANFPESAGKRREKSLHTYYVLRNRNSTRQWISRATAAPDCGMKSGVEIRAFDCVGPFSGLIGPLLSDGE